MAAATVRHCLLGFPPRRSPWRWDSSPSA